MYYSNINEAWKHDPVKEITNKLSNESFQNNPHAEIFNLKTGKKNIDTSDIASLSILSDDTNFEDSDISYELAQSKKRRLFDSSKTTNRYNKIPLLNTDCNDSIKHLQKCNWCHDKLIKLINSNINKKFNELVLENKLKQLEQFTNETKSNTQTSSACWKDTLIIVAGIVISLIVILLIVKSFNK